MAGDAHRGGVGKASGNVVWHGAANRCRAGPRARVTTHAICRVERVVVAGVAGGARSRCRRHVCASQRESGRAVIEGGSVPACRGVTGRTVCGGKRCASG